MIIDLIHGSFVINLLQYVIVMRDGIYYKLNVYDKKGQPVLPQILQEKLRWIIEDTEKHIGTHTGIW